MLYLTCTMISRVDLAHHGVSCAKDWVSVDCGASGFCSNLIVAFWECYLYIEYIFALIYNLRFCFLYSFNLVVKFNINYTTVCYLQS